MGKAVNGRDERCAREKDNAGLGRSEHGLIGRI